MKPAGVPETSFPPARTLVLALGALGIVFGDIGTSPLYAIKECFHGLHAVAVSRENILGVLSLVFWSLTVVVSIKYISFVLRADNRGEGGIFALLALIPADLARINPKLRAIVILAAMMGASLLYGDAVITPAISVLSAIEGLEVATETAEPYILPITCMVLLGLFTIQSRGTGDIGKVFGPVMFIWFFALAALGIRQIIFNPEVLEAINPIYAFNFFMANGIPGFVVLGSVVLAITGGEALYADMGHFGKHAIRLSWLTVAFPALLLNYFGQGALLLNSPDRAVNPFYELAPKALLYPLVGLATAATVIASQAMISGVFSLTQQAIQLGFVPRLRIVHTSGETRGQIFIPSVNRALMIACIGLVLAFQSSSRLAGAYGIAVTADMAITSILFFFVLTRTWQWPPWRAVPVVLLFLLFDLSYFSANLFKIADGGWFTLTMAAVMMTILTTWRDGRATLARKLQATRLPLSLFLDDVASHNPVRVPGTAVFMSISPVGVPSALLHHYKHNHVLHEQVLILSIQSMEVPVVVPEQRLEIEDLGHGFFRLIAHYGFMEKPDVPEIMRVASSTGLELEYHTTTFFLSRETLLTSGQTGMMQWRKKLFAFISRNAGTPTVYFGIPLDRVIELGIQIDI